MDDEIPKSSSNLVSSPEEEQDRTEKILLGTAKTLEDNDKVRLDLEDNELLDEDKECTSMVSAISNEEASILSELVMETKSFCPRKNSDGEDVNGHIGHIDSPETDTYPNSDPLQGESLMEDLRSMLGGFDQDSVDNTYTDDTTLLNSDICDLKHDRKKSLKGRDSFDKKRRVEDDAQFGFENRAFMSQHVYLDNRFETDPPR